jgi:hypothetical protein
MFQLKEELLLPHMDLYKEGKVLRQLKKKIFQMKKGLKGRLVALLIKLKYILKILKDLKLN